MKHSSQESITLGLADYIEKNDSLSSVSWGFEMAKILGNTFPSYSLVIFWLTYRMTTSISQAILVSFFISVPTVLGLFLIFWQNRAQI